MTKMFIKILLLITLFTLCFSNVIYAVNGVTNYLFIWDDYCIIVRTPQKQLTNSPGQVPLGIILKDNTTKITLSGAYMSIAIPSNKLNDTLKKYKLNNLTLIE